MRLFILLGLFLCFAFTAQDRAYAQATAGPDIAPQPCDTEYWKQMSARAWMEAQREIMQNQNLIFKPDSVLEYVCFDQFASIAAHEGGDIFTHTEYFGNMIVPRGSNEAMEVAITNVVSDALQEYIDSSFGHDYLGGRATHMSIADKDSQLRPATQRVGYTCEVMKNVWQAAKCANFIDDEMFENTDGFYPFATLQGHNGSPAIAGYDSDYIQETRNFPSQCGNVVNTPGGNQTVTGNFGPQGRWADQIALANNEGLYPYQEPLNAVFTEVFKRTSPNGSLMGDGTRLRCVDVPAIKTGVMIYSNDGTSYEDGICTNPGCVFNKTGYCIAIAITGESSSITTTTEDEDSAGGG